MKSGFSGGITGGESPFVAGTFLFGLAEIDSHSLPFNGRAEYAEKPITCPS